MLSISTSRFDLCSLSSMLSNWLECEEWITKILFMMNDELQFSSCVLIFHNNITNSLKSQLVIRFYILFILDLKFLFLHHLARSNSTQLFSLEQNNDGLICSNSHLFFFRFSLSESSSSQWRYSHRRIKTISIQNVFKTQQRTRSIRILRFHFHHRSRIRKRFSCRMTSCFEFRWNDSRFNYHKLNLHFILSLFLSLSFKKQSSN